MMVYTKESTTWHHIYTFVADNKMDVPAGSKYFMRLPINFLQCEHLTLREF